MRNHFTATLIILGISLTLSGQLAPELNYPSLRYKADSWQASWIRCPDAPEADYGVILFRKSFNIPGKPKVHLRKKSDGGVEGTIEIPSGIKGTFHFNKKSLKILPGLQQISL